MEKVDIECWFTNTKLLARLLGVNEATFKPVMIVVQTEDPALLSNSSYLDHLLAEAQGTMAKDGQLQTSIAYAKQKFPVSEVDGGSAFSKFYGVDPQTAKALLILYGSPAKYECITCPWQFVWNCSPAEMSNKEKTIKLTINSYEKDDKFIVHCETKKIQARMPYLYDEYDRHYSSQYDWEEDPDDKVKIFKTKKARVFDEKAMFDLMVRDLKDVTLETLSKAVQDAAEEFNKCNYFQLAQEFPFAIGSGRKTHVAPLRGKDRVKTWRCVVERFIAFLHFMFQENRELVQERRYYEQGDEFEAGEQSESSRIFRFKPNEIDKIRFSGVARKLLAHSDELVEMLCSGFDLSKTPKIVEESEERKDAFMGFMSFNRERKGEILKKQIAEFTTTYLEKPDHILMWFNKVAKSILDKDSQKYQNINRIMIYFYDEYIKKYGAEIRKSIVRNDKERENYFKVMVNMVDIITKSEYRKDDANSINWFVTGSALKDVPNLPNEFYKMLFQKTKELSKKVYFEYFNSTLISKHDKSEMMFSLIAENVGTISLSLSEMVGEFILNPNTIPLLSLDDLFGLFKVRYPLLPNMVDEFIRKRKNCNLHRAVLRSINLIVKKAQRERVETPFLRQHADSYFLTLQREIVKYMDSCLSDVSIRYINNSEFINAGLVNYLEEFKPASYDIRKFSDVIDDYNGRLRVIKNNLAFYIDIFEKNHDYMQEYDFQKPFMKLLKDFRTDIDNYTIVQIEKNQSYIDCTCLRDPIWDAYHTCQEYLIFYEELKARCTKDINLVNYKKQIDTYCADLKSRFLGFLDDKKYTLKDYHYHFRRIMWTEKIDVYEAAVKALGLSDKERYVLFNHSRAFHALHKILKLKEPIETLVGFKFLTLSSSPFITNIKKLFDQFTGKEFDKITYEDLKKADKTANNILVTEDYSKCKVYQLPIVIRNISASPDVLNFMKEKGTDFIKSMRDECDNENLDIINKLDVINKNLNFIVQEKSIDSVLEKLTALPKVEQRKLKQYLSSIEGLITSHIVHLADKTKKDTGYNRKIINHILDKSTLTLQYSVEQKDYSTVVKYFIAGNPFTVDSIELGELFNKAKIIVNENQNKEEKLDEYQQCMSDFNALGKELHDLTSSLKVLRALGLIDSKFNDLIEYLNSHTTQKCFATNEIEDKKAKNYATELIINFGKESNGTEVLQKVNSELKGLTEKLTTELYSYYSQECYLFTYFYGKKLYYLLEYLRGRLGPAESEEVLNLVREAFPDDMIKFNNNYHISKNPSEVFRDVFDVLKDWSKQIAARQRIKLNSSRVFQLKKIVVVVNPVMNKYKTMIKIMAEAGENIFSLSQVLFCRKETTRNEIYAFVNRSLLDPFKRIYFIMNIHVLEYYLLLELRNFINKTIELESENVNYNLLVFADKTEYHKDLLENANFCKDLQLDSLETFVTDDDIRNKYSHVFTANQLVMSPVAGMGKTTYIGEKSKKYDLVELFLAGELNKGTITKRLNNLSRQAQDKNKLAINIKLDFIEDFSVYSELVDYTLFCVSLVNRYYTDRGCRDLRGNLKLVFFEIGNTFSTELLLDLDTLKIFNVDPKPEEAGRGAASMHRYKVITKNFSLDNVNYSDDVNSDQQVVANFCKMFDAEELVLSQCNEANRKVIPEEEFRGLLKKHFMAGKSAEEKGKITYAQYSFWLKTLATMVREMENVGDLAPSKLEKDNIPVETRGEIASEINIFCSQIINLSVNQAKTSQDEMKKILSNLTKDKIKANKMDEYKNKFVKLEPWDSSDMVVPLFNKTRALIAHTNLELFNRPGSQRYRNRLNLKRFIREKKTFIDPEKTSNPSEEYLKRLSDLLGTDFDDLKARSRQFMGGKGFSITRENFMKMCLIILKAELKTPIIMMGESGCGKTYVSQYTSKVLMQEELHELTLYSGVTEADFVNFMKKAIAAANEAAKIGKRVWVFFDEFNTSCLQSIVAEIMLDRRCPIDLDIYQIPDNIVFISCCNPYRMKTKKADVGLVPKTTDNLLSHRVYPIPERLINFIWDFGQLSDKDEYNHLRSIIEANKIFDQTNVNGMLNFCNLIYTAHKFVRDIEERSGVSLRDIKRVITIYNWFKGTLEFYEKNVLEKKRENNVINHLNAAIASVMVCYGLRLNGRPEQVEFIKKLVTSANQARSLGYYMTEEIRSILSKIAQNHFDELESLKAGIIPDGIALNTPLKENFIAMLACFDTMTPLIICGAPGTSKTLCTQIFNSALTPNVIKNCKIFSRYKGINAMYYGGSQTSTSEGISKVFQRGDKYLENKGEDRPVVVFDEIGLAELSPYNPLKILHPLLEKVNMEVGFLGLSNWTLDLSKMNRLIYLARPDMTQEDLFEIFKISIIKCTNPTIRDDLERFLKYLTVAYLKFRDWQKKHGSHPNFHGSRDIYGVSKFIYRELQKIKHYDTSTKSRDLIKLAIERNFNGAIYLFGKVPPEIPEDTVPNLEQGFAKKNLLNMIRIKEFGNPYDTEPDKLDNLEVAAQTTESSVIYGSTEVFKKLFVNEMLRNKDSALQLFESDFLAEHKVLEMVNMNINDNAARFLLIKSEGEVIDNIFLEKLREFNKSDKIIDWRGVRGKENSIELLSTLKSYISLGYVVVMKNLDELYGSLYDLFNQKYMEVDGRQYCYLYYGENKHRVEVHPDFKAIVIIPSEKELEGLDVELEQPAPFLNRFEKFFLRMSNILSLRKIQELIVIRNHLKKTVQGYSSRVLALSIDMLASLCVNKKEVGLEDGDGIAEGSNQLPVVTDKHKQGIMKLTTLNYLLYEDLTDEDIKHFLEEHPYFNFDDVLVDLSKRTSAKICLMTFSNPMEIEPLRETIQANHGLKIHSSEEIYTLGLEKRSQLIKNYKESTFAIQFIYTEHLSMISQIKSNIEQNSKITKTLFIIHLERDPRKREILSTNIGVNYWNDWDNRVLDNIQHTYYKEFVQIKNLTFEELLLSTTYATGINLFKEAVLMCIIKITHDEKDMSLRINMFNIRTMIQNDPDNIFIDAFREKVKTTKIFTKDPTSWIKIIRDRNSARDFYVDLEVELLNYFKDKYSEEVKKYIQKLNYDLANIASYSLGYLSTIPEVKELFKLNLKKGIEECILTQAEVQKHTMMIKRNSNKDKQISFFRLPFLSPIYKKLQQGLSEQIQRENIAEFNRLSNFTAKLKVAVLYKVAEEQAEILRAKIANAEKFLSEAIAKVIGPIIGNCQEKLTGLIESPEIKNALALDILSIASGNIEVIHQQEILEIFRIICFMLNRNSTDDLIELFSTACILSISLKSQTVFLLEIMNISNFSSQEIDEFRKKLDRHQEQYKLDYGSIDKFVNFCQEKLIPEFDDPKLKLRLYRDKYEKLIDRLMYDNPNIAENDLNIYNFRSLINLFGLLDILPTQKRLNYLSKLKDIKNQRQRFGSNTHLDFVRQQILTIFFESGDIKDIKTSDYCLILSEHIAINAVMCNFELFLQDKYDLLFSKFSKQETEKISATLGSTLAQRIPDFYSLSSLKKTLEVIQTDSVFQEYNKMLSGINLDKKRNLYFVVSFIDCLYIKGISNMDRPYDREFVEILQFILEHADFSKEYKSLQNMIFYSILRVIFNPKIMRELLINNPEWIQRVDNLFIENSRSKEYFCNNPNSTVFIYWLQSIIREYGDLGTYQPSFPAINNVCTLILEEDVQGTITFFDTDIRGKFVSLRDELDDASYKKDINRMREIFARTHNGDRRIQHYMIGVALINKFVNQVKQTDMAVVQNLKNSYSNMFSQMNENPLYMELLKMIVDDNTMAYTQFMSNETDPQFNIRLRKTFLQFMLVSILFESFGYNYNGWKEWKDEIDYTSFKCKLANTEKINNYCSVGENIIIERLADGSYQDYGHNLGKNLGIYRCSCGHIYSIGNCGYAMMKSKCPKCGLDIGGEGHNLLQREGHIHIKTLPDLFGMIKEEYYKACGYYNMHTVVNHTSLEFFPLKIIEIGPEKFLEKRKMKANTPFWQVFFCNLFIRHLFDHMFLTILPETLTTTKEAFNTKVKQIINYDLPIVKELYGKMSGKEIHNHMEYFLAHVKNDIDVLSKELLFENPVDIFDWTRAMLTTLVEKMHKGAEFRQSDIPILTETDVTQPKQLIIEQEKNIEAMVSTDISTKFVVKSVFFRKVDGDLLRGFMREYKDESHFIYQFLRHNKFERSKLFAEFNKQLEVSDCTLLKLIVKYNHVLKEFPRMVKANLDLAYYLMNNYSRLYNFDEASSVDILSLPDPRIKELFKEFEYVWEHIIPKHEDTNPEIFSFAYLCQQNLNVDGFIKRIRSAGGAILVNLVFVDSKVYASQDLLYMKAILETFIKKFHNMFVEHINKVMQIELADVDRTLAEFCDEGSFMSSHNYEPLIESNFWYNTEVSGENELYFDLKRIEYLCAKAMKKKWINFEEADLVYYMFKDANAQENAKTIEDMLKKIETIELDPNEKQVVEQMNEVQITKSHEFLMEIGDYVYQNFLFHDNQRHLKNIIESIDSLILRKRFNAYDDKLHARLKVGHLPDYYGCVMEKKFNFTFSVDRDIYNKPLTTEQKVSFKELIDDPNVEGDDLEKIKIEIKDVIREYYEKGTEFTKLMIKDFVYTLSEIAPGTEFIGDLTFGQFLAISDILNDGIMLKNKNNFVRRTSSNIYGHAEMRRSSNMRED